MIRGWIRNFMIGRYGPDHLNIFIMITAMVLAVVSTLTGWPVLSFLSYALLIYATFRWLSRNITARRRENDKFLKYWWPVRQWFMHKYVRFKESKSYAFFKCPACKNTLRVPKGKGRIQITCPKCGERFEKKT